MFYMHGKKLYGTTTVGTKGQAVIPSAAREDLGINAGDRLYVIGSPTEGFVVLLQEDKIEKFIDQMNIHVEMLKTLKKPKK